MGFLSLQSIIPPSTVLPYAGQTAPEGWLLCQGQAVSRTTYSALFAAIGTTYGSGDEVSTFNLPNTQGVFLRGAGSQTISGKAFSGTPGVSQIDAYPAHDHGGGNHGHVTSYNATTRDTGSQATGIWDGALDAARSDVVWASGTIVGVNGSGTETKPANICVNYIIKI